MIVSHAVVELIHLNRYFIIFEQEKNLQIILYLFMLIY